MLALYRKVIYLIDQTKNQKAAIILSLITLKTQTKKALPIARFPDRSNNLSLHITL